MTLTNLWLAVPLPFSISFGNPNRLQNWKTWRKFLNYGLLTSMTLAVFTA
jgi:hypothetical protein